MAHVQVTIPAVALDLGCGAGSLGLALGLHNVVEMMFSDDGNTHVMVSNTSDLAGEVVLRAVEALLLLLKQEMPPLTILCRSGIPSRCGLGDEETWVIGGLMGINNLLGAPLNRGQIAEMAVRMTSLPAAAIAALMGGLIGVSAAEEHHVLYRRLDVAISPLVLVVPEVADYRIRARKLIAQHNADSANRDHWQQRIGRTVLLVEALRKGDYPLLAQVAIDPLLDKERVALLAGGGEAIRAAKEAGAATVIISGEGPALLAFAARDHQQVEMVMRECFTTAGVKCRTWLLGVDTQGVAITVRG